MLVIKIALWPMGMEALEKPLGVLIIANVGPSLEVENTCNYQTALTTERMDKTITAKKGSVLNWDRTLPVEQLVRAALAALEEKEGVTEPPPESGNAATGIKD